MGDEALCNIGEFIPPSSDDDNDSKEQQQQQQQQQQQRQSQSIIVKCTVEKYKPAAKRGALVLQGQEEYVTILPVWKLQHRHVAKQK